MMNEIRKCKDLKEKREIIKNCGSVIELIKGCENLNELYEIIIIISYDVKLDNRYQKQDYTGRKYSYAEGYYLINKKIKCETESHLDTLILSIKKKLNKIYRAEIKEVGDKEFYETLACTELLEALHHINNMYGFEFILSKFEDVDSVNQFCGFVVSIVANKNMQKVRGNKTTAVIAKAKKINNRTLWTYNTVNFMDIEGSTTDAKTTETSSTYDYILKEVMNYTNSIDSGLYNIDNYKGEKTNEIDNDNIISYLSSKLNLLTSTQQEYLKSSGKRNYQMDKKIRERLSSKLGSDNNLTIEYDESGNLKSIKLKDSYTKVLDVILSQRGNKSKFLKMIEYLKKNNRYSDSILDSILNNETKFYAPIIKYMNDEILDLDYVNKQFNHVLYKLKL